MLNSRLSDDQLSRNLAKYNILLGKLTTVSQIDKLTEVIKNDQEQTVASLNVFIAESQSKHNKQIRKLELQRTDLTSTLSQYHSVLSTIGKSNNRSVQIHNEIDSIDQEHKLLLRTLSFLEDTRTLKNNIKLIDSALKEQNYLVAATAISEIRQLPPGILESSFAKNTIPNAELPMLPSELLAQWCNQLKGSFKSSFEIAMREKDIDRLTLFFKLFPLIGETDLGLDLYSKYICDIISVENKKFLDNTVNLKVRFSVVLLNLFKIVSTIINEHSRIISNCYGKEHIPVIMEKIEKETELQASLVLDVFSDAKHMKETVTNISNETVPINEAANFLSEISQILQNWSMYTRFFAVKWKEYTDFSETETTLKIPFPIVEGTFSSKLHKDNFIRDFQDIVINNLYRSFRNSVILEELPDINNVITLETISHKDQSSWPISPVLEDLTALIRKNMIYTVNTGQVDILSTFLDDLVVFIQNEYLVKFIQAKFKTLQSVIAQGSTASSSPNLLKKYTSIPEESSTQYPSRAASPYPTNKNVSSTAAATAKLSQFSRFNLRGAFANIQSNLQSVVAQEEEEETSSDPSILSLHHYIIYVNTLCLTKAAIENLLTKEIIEQNPRLIQDNFPFEDDSTYINEKVETAQINIIEQVNKLQKWGIQYLFQNLVQPKLKIILKKLFINDNNNAGSNEDNASTYIANIENFENFKNINKFMRDWRVLITPLKNAVITSAFDDLMKLINSFMIKIIEKRVWNLKVNELGAIKLDKELSLLINATCELNYTLRENFVRLTQIVLILGFDDDDFDLTTGDVKDEIVNSIDWILNPQERIKARNLKIDKRH
ncbi:hypothetical protein KAFR_0D04240 [Kazachstania africana CBS 2517]|uniref:Conserved oligomeric Golgi complex subunit 4 n=1 Tax=Kazachstania africana (strain ATCC 22294 / BCRC 22015 / CBS 2517 / CECT 1963 / NBRC 1671 / NRRL Y-8276) TaxID=1071382 RepID=H2AUM2_KAZAF|nr:hypothetical protein KAFR_0D04240 [Kazachstania africana CBS 2517]CCF58072.1 hypothetical protein KAFR_0D04240 [Kazachstania africana CBS 2517]